MGVKLTQLNVWVSMPHPRSDLVYACVELGEDPKGSDDELIARLVGHISQMMTANGANAEANLSPEFEKVVQAAFTAPRQQPQRAAATTPAAQAATGHTAGAPQGTPRPVHQNALQRFFRPQPKPGQEGMSAWMLFWKNR